MQEKSFKNFTIEEKTKKFSEIVVNKFQRLKKLYKKNVLKVQNKQSNQRCYLGEW